MGDPDSVERYHPLAKCEECPLYEHRSYVPSKQARTEKATLAVVGEAPGYRERVEGEPFVGPSGRLLFRVLEHYEYKRDEVFLTNACCCRPPDNATPTKAAVYACNERLIEEVKASGASDILSLGTTATTAILRTPGGVTVQRVGPYKTSDKLPGLRIVPTFHPAACLRNGDNFPHLVADAGKFRVTLPEWKPPQYVVLDDEERALAAIAELDKLTDRLVLDIECGIDKDISYDHPNHYQMLCIGVGYAKGKVAVFGEKVMDSEAFREAFKALCKAKKLICHNGKFDLSGLVPLLGALELWFDTMLANYCLDERPGGHSLGTLGQEILGAPDWKKEIAPYLVKSKNYANIPRPILYKYNAYDASVTWDLMEYYEVRLDTGLRRLHDHLVEASNQLMFLELNGITFDKQYSDKLSEEYQGELTHLESQLNDFVREDYDKRGGLNPRSPQQLQAFFQDSGIKVASTDEKHLKAIIEKLPDQNPMNAFCQLLLINRRRTKLYGTYIKGLRSRLYRGRIYTTYSLHGTTSGRLASRNPNLQNIVRDVRIRRQFVVAEPDNTFIQADYKQAEGRVIATLAGDEYLRGIFADDSRDIFAELSDKLYGVGRWGKEQRVRTKAYFYGISYGRQAFDIAQEHHMSVREAERDLERFMDVIPDVAAWQQDIKQRVLAGEDLVTSFGRRRRFYLITNDNRKDVLNEALSFMPQSTASDITLRALVVLRPLLRGKAFIRLTIHDALVVECKEDRKEEVSELLSTTMLQEARNWTDYVPFAVDLSYGKDWGSL